MTSAILNLHRFSLLIESTTVDNIRSRSYLDEHAGIIRTLEFQRAGLHNSYLTTLVDEGRIVRLKPGLYLATEAQTPTGFFEVQLALPHAVVCLASALAHYDLTTCESPEVQVAIPRGDRMRLPDFPPSRRFSLGDDRHSLGIEPESTDGREIRIYDREKSICDAIRFRWTAKGHRQGDRVLVDASAGRTGSRPLTDLRMKNVGASIRERLFQVAKQVRFSFSRWRE